MGPHKPFGALSGAGDAPVAYACEAVTVPPRSLGRHGLLRVSKNADTGELPPQELRRTDEGEHFQARTSYLALAEETAGIGLSGVPEKTATAKPRVCGELCVGVKP